MMKAEELRLNNWVIATLCDDSKEYQQVTALHTSRRDGRTTYFESEFMKWSKFEPIPLTEEILLKCGFEKEIYNHGQTTYKIKYGDKRRNNFEIDLDRNMWWWEWQSGIKIIDNSLHFIQNLYYSLTGQELEIDL